MLIHMSYNDNLTDTLSVIVIYQNFLSSHQNLTNSSLEIVWGCHVYAGQAWGDIWVYCGYNIQFHLIIAIYLVESKSGTHFDFDEFKHSWWLEGIHYNLGDHWGFWWTPDHCRIESRDIPSPSMQISTDTL